MPDWFNNLFSFFRREEFVLVFIVDLIFLIIPDQWLHDGVAAFRAENIGWFVVLLMASLVVTIGLGYQKVVARIDQKRKAQEAEVDRKRKEQEAEEKTEIMVSNLRLEFSGMSAQEIAIVLDMYFNNHSVIRVNTNQPEISNLLSLGYLVLKSHPQWDSKRYDYLWAVQLSKKARFLMNHCGADLLNEFKDHLQ